MAKSIAISEKDAINSSNCKMNQQTQKSNKRKNFQCNICQLQFTVNYNLRYHLYKIHNKQTLRKVKQCLFCSMWLPSNSTLEEHTRTHTLEKPYFCNLCPAEFSQKCTLKSHLQAIHFIGRQKRHECYLCGKMFYSSGHLNAHIRQHLKEKPFKCSLCGKRFKTLYNEREHRQVHIKENPFQCQHCAKKFSGARSLRRHTLSHSKEKPFSCPICQKKFMRQDCLKTHLRVHSGEKPFRCEICQKLFSESGTLKTHMRIHTGEKPFKCKYCDKIFSFNGSRRLHENKFCKGASNTASSSTTDLTSK